MKWGWKDYTYNPKEEILWNQSSGSIRWIDGVRYHQVSEYWWAGQKPGIVTEEAKNWRSRGYLARQTHTRVESGRSWNNGDVTMKKYSLYVAVPWEETEAWDKEQYRLFQASLPLNERDVIY